MKRLISLILAVALLLSLAPAVFADGEEAGGVALAFGTIREIEQDVYDTTDKVKYYAIPVVVKNTTSEEIMLNALQCIFNYDESGLAPANIQADEYSFIDPITFSSKPVSEWESKDGNAANGLITVIAATTKSNYYVRVKAGQERVLFELNLARVNDVENGDYNVTFADPYLNDDGKRMQNKIGYDDTDIQISYSQSEGNLDLTDEEKITITDGKAPVLASVAVDKDEVGYASGDVITLSAKSASGNDITGLVSFSIKDYTGTGLEITGNQLTVSAENPANVGTYTVTATPEGSGCTAGENVETATFTIAPKTVTNPTLTVVGFGKGQAKGFLTFEDVTGGLAVPTGYRCYKGAEATGNPDHEGNFEAGTTYSIAITLHPAANYAFDELDPGYLTVTINGEEQKAKIEKGPEFNGVSEYQAVVTATTADKDEPTLDLKDLSATYGDKLLNLKLDSCSASFNGQPVEGTFAWADEYNAETPVGDAGEQTFDVVFTPTDKEVYATVTGTVTVTVAQKEIEFKTSDYEWKSINPDDTYTVDSYGRMCFQYDGNEHGIEPNCKNDDIRDLVEFEYVAQFTTNKSTNVIGSTVKAQVLLKNNNYKFDKTSTVIKDGDWKVVPIVIDYAGEYTHSVDVCYTTSSVDIPLSAFGLPDEVLNDTNNKYLMRNEAVVVDEGDVISGTPTAFDDTTLTLTLNLKSSLTKDDAGKTASVTLGLKVNNYETTNPGVEEIAGGEDKLFILKLNVKIIEKENAGLTITGIPESLVYGESAEWSYNVTKPGENGNISGSVTPAGILNNDPYKLTAIGVGEATVTITYSSDTTYAQEKFTITVTPKPLTAAVSHDPITYGDPTPTEGYTVTFNGLLTGDVLADTDYTVGTEYKQGDPVGKYAFTCVLNSETVKNYKLDTVNGELVVNKKELTDGDVTVTVLGETPVYDGSEKKPAVEVKYGETTLAAADYTVSYSNNVNAGVNTASVTVTSNDNSSYKFTATKNFTIAQAPISGAMIANIPSVTYNTRAHTPEVTVTFNGSKLTDADYTVSYSEDCINAGTATVTVTGKGNFTGTASKTFTINKAGLTLNPCTISELCTETDLKTRTLPSDFFLAGETETGFSIKLTAVEGGDDIFAVAPAVVEGENKITFRLKNEVGAATFTVTVTPVSGNYNGGSYALTISTHDRTDVSGSISFPDGSAVYTGTGIKYENATISGYSGTLRYGYTPNASTGASLDASGLPLTVGTYTVAVTFSSDASFGYKTATFTITKATPTGTPGYTKLETSGKTLADAKLTVGTIRPAGTIAWDLPLTTVLEDGKAYAWTFTPADTHNYTILTGTLVPYVDDGMDYIPGVIGGNTGSFNFHDVGRLDYFYDAVKWAAENGIASGTGRYTFSPNAVCTRAQTVTFLWRAAGSPLPRYRVCPFTDVQPSDYYYNAVLWAVEQGITTGLNATTFGPDVTVTRGQVATFLYRAASAAKPSTFNPFTDVKTTAYNYNAILWAYDNRITTGTSDTTFSPDAYCTRAQIVTFLYRYYQGR